MMDSQMQRRSFLAAPLAAWQLKAAETEKRVYATGDGIPHTPAEYAALLASLTGKGEIARDHYSLGGVVEQLESQVAAVLGKEAAVWLPTGTLANHLAVRLLAGNRRRVLVQAESHLMNDCGDCAGTLSGLHLMPLAPGKATFTLEEVERAAYESSMGRVATPIGAIQIESPVRRRQGERFDFEQMKKIAAWARAHSVGLHLDGARIFLECGYTSRPVKEYTALFDTVYVSMYKYFNAAAGAVLAGPKALLADLFQTRRMFGGGLVPSVALCHGGAALYGGLRAALPQQRGNRGARDHGPARRFELRRGSHSERHQHLPDARLQRQRAGLQATPGGCRDQHCGPGWRLVRRTSQRDLESPAGK